METQHGRKTLRTGSVISLYGELKSELRKQTPERHRALGMMMNGDDTRLAARLKEAITASGATHYAIGKQAGIRPDLLDRFMRGERDLRLASAGKIANALGLDLVPTSTAKRSPKRPR